VFAYFYSLTNYTKTQRDIYILRSAARYFWVLSTELVSYTASGCRVFQKFVHLLLQNYALLSTQSNKPFPNKRIQISTHPVSICHLSITFKAQLSYDYIDIRDAKPFYDLKHGPPNFIWQRATPDTVGWFAGRTLNNYSK
jgi:hypothetical protein